MKKLMLAFVILVLAVWLGVTMHQQANYVLIGLGHWRVETSLWLALLLVLLLFFAVYWLLRLISGAYHLPQRYERWRHHRREHKSHQLTELGICALLKGQWKQAETTLVKAAQSGELKFIDYLGAAKAAQKEKNISRRDAYLHKAGEKNIPDQLLALGIVQASWQLESGQWDAALQTLRRIHGLAPKNTVVLLGMKQAYLALQQWDALRDLLPKLQKTQALCVHDLKQLQVQIYSVLLDRSAVSQQLAALEKQWQAVPANLHEDAQLLTVYIRHLLQMSQSEKAEQLLKIQLKKFKDPRLLKLYATLVSKDSAKQLHRAEGWLKLDPNNPELVFCLGQLCARHRLWGKARSYLETAIKLQPQNSAIYQSQGKVLEKLGDQVSALRSYRKGLEVAISELPPT